MQIFKKQNYLLTHLKKGQFSNYVEILFIWPGKA